MSDQVETNTAYGLVGITAVGFVIGAVYAAIYNLVRDVGGASQK